MKRSTMAALSAMLVPGNQAPSLVGERLSSMQMLIMRNIVDGTHRRGVTDENKAEHDQTFVDLLKRGFISYKRKAKANVRMFDLTPTGCEALAKAEEAQGQVLGG